MATYVNFSTQLNQIQLLMISIVRAASKDLDLEDTYLKLLKDTSPHEKAITRDLGRCGFLQ